MDEKQTPYLYKSGLNLDFEQLLLATDFTTQARLDENTKQFTNGMMAELIKFLKNMDNKLFFKLLKSIVPLSIVNSPRFPVDYQHFAASRLKVFNADFKKFRKTPAKFTEFLEKEFIFVTRERNTDTPRKKELKKRIHDLEVSNEELAQSSTQVQDELALLEGQLQEKEKDILATNNKLAILENEKQSLQQKIKGIKSGITRKKQKQLFSSPVKTEDKCIQIECITANKCITTDIKNIEMNDLVIFDDKGDVDSKDGIFEGTRYFGKEHRKSTSGWKNFYFEIPSKARACSKIGKKDVQKRAKLFGKFSCYLAGSSSNEERLLLLTEFIKANKDLFRDALQQAGFKLLDVLTAQQAITIHSLLRMPTNKIRNLRIFLSKFNVNILPSERQIRKERAPMVSHVNEESVESGFIGLRKTKNEENVTQCAYLRVKDIHVFIEEIIKRDTSGFNHSEEFGGKWWILFSGDKGGHFMKYHLEIVNSFKAGSVDNVHIYCMFEATDSVENMRKVWLPYNQQILRMYEEDFTICGRGVQIFLGGDYHFLDDNMGHQGSSATYPSSTDKVLLSHLQNHENQPHIPSDCPVEKRSIKDYIENYNENLADSRNSKNLNDNGKYHNSVVGPMIFPLNSIEQVVPATLHILLGVVLLLYNLLLDECKRNDAEVGTTELEEEKQKLNDEWEDASLHLLNAEKDLREHGENIITMINRLHRYEAIVQGNTKENLKLSNVSDTRKKSKKRGTADKCKAENCFITLHDVNVEWVCCDTCDDWYHSMCEGLTPIEEVGNAEYVCVNCSGRVDRSEVFTEKIDTLIYEEDVLNRDIVSARITCDNLKAKYTNVIGTRERSLILALESIKVIRQAYHGNVMVGNHCIIVLKKFLVLTSIISDNEDLYQKFNKIFEIFSNIMNLVMSRRFLDDHEISTLEDLCSLGEPFPYIFHIEISYGRCTS